MSWGWGSKAASIVMVLVIAGVWLNSCEPEGSVSFAATPMEVMGLHDGAEITGARFLAAAEPKCAGRPGGILGWLWGGPDVVRVSAVDTAGTELRWIKVDCDDGRLHA